MPAHSRLQPELPAASALPKPFCKPSDRHKKEARVSFANQGIYNGMLGLSLIISYWLFSGTVLIKVWLLLLSFVIVVAFDQRILPTVQMPWPV